jgi:hypothetical protein
LAFSTWYSRYRSFGIPSSEYAGSCDDAQDPVAQRQVLQLEGLQQGIVGAGHLAVVSVSGWCLMLWLAPGQYHWSGISALRRVDEVSQQPRRHESSMGGAS